MTAWCSLQLIGHGQKLVGFCHFWPPLHLINTLHTGDVNEPPHVANSRAHLSCRVPPIVLAMPAQPTFTASIRVRLKPNQAGLILLLF
jgi:hypothetical protein